MNMPSYVHRVIIWAITKGTRTSDCSLIPLPDFVAIDARKLFISPYLQYCVHVRRKSRAAEAPQCEKKMGGGREERRKAGTNTSQGRFEVSLILALPLPPFQSPPLPPSPTNSIGLSGGGGGERAKKQRNISMSGKWRRRRGSLDRLKRRQPCCASHTIHIGVPPPPSSPRLG